MGAAERQAFARPAGLPDKWTDDEALLRAVRAYVVGGNPADHLPMTDAEVRFWTNSYQWAKLTALVVPEIKETLRGHLSRISHKAVTELSERIENGDEVLNIDGSPKLNEDGEPIRRKLKARDLADIAQKMMSEQRALESKIGGYTDDDGKVSLEKLARGLMKLATIQEVPGDIIDVEAA